jgi:hypothetical protein
MSGGGSHDDGLGEFSSEADEHAPPARSESRHALESPRLVPLVVAAAVIGYGGLMVLWWERDTPNVKPSFSAAPTTSFRPVPSRPAPEAAAAAAPTPPHAVELSDEVADDFFVPAVARPVRPAPASPGTDALDLPGPIPAPLPDPAVDSVPPPLPGAPVAPVEVAAPVVAAAAPEPAAVDPIVSDRLAIGDVLQSYRTAYNALDATSVSTIWQGLDTRALQRAFATLSQQDVTFDRCEVRVTAADRAAASCRGVLRYVPKVGDSEPQERRLSWNFDFQRAAGRWLIASVSAR